MMSTHEDTLALLPRDTSVHGGGDVIQTSKGNKQKMALFAAALDDDAPALITCDSEESFSTITAQKTSDIRDKDEGTTFNCALDNFCVCITVHDLSDDVTEKDGSNHSSTIQAEHVEEAEIEADKETEIEAETTAPKSDSSKIVEVNSAPIDTEAAREDHACFAFLDMCADLAFIDMCAGINAGFDLLDRGADQCLACFGLDDLCGDTPGQEETSLEAEPTDAAKTGQEETIIAAEPMEVAMILDEDDKDIDVEELQKCVDCILEEESGSRMFMRKKKDRNKIKTSKGSGDKGKAGSVRKVLRNFGRRRSTVSG